MSFKNPDKLKKKPGKSAGSSNVKTKAPNPTKTNGKPKKPEQ